MGEIRKTNQKSWKQTEGEKLMVGGVSNYYAPLYILSFIGELKANVARFAPQYSPAFKSPK